MNMDVKKVRKWMVRMKAEDIWAKEVGKTTKKKEKTSDKKWRIYNNEVVRTI